MRLIDADELKEKTSQIVWEEIDSMPTIEKLELSENSIIKVTFDLKKIKPDEAIKMFNKIKSMFPDNKVFGFIGCDINTEKENHMTVTEKYKVYKLAFEHYVEDNLGLDETNYSKAAIKKELKLEMEEYLEQAKVELFKD